MAAFPLAPAKPSSLGLHDRALDRLQELITDPWHSERLDRVSNCVHAAID